MSSSNVPPRPVELSPGTGNQIGKMHQQAREIFDWCLRQSSIPAAFTRQLRIEDRRLLISGSDRDLGYKLEQYSAIYIVALGKAALPMTEAFLKMLQGQPQQRSIRGVCSAPVLPARPHPGIEYFAGGHPFPNPDSLHSARAALGLLSTATPETLVVFLISGGGSSLFEAPLETEISLEETVAFHRALVGCGAAISEINTVRKHFSAVKGGRLAAAAADAHKLSLLVSDVPEGRLDALASGPTVPDSSTREECGAILERYRLFDQLPPRVRAFFRSPDLPETPKHPLGLWHARVLLSNQDLVEAARCHAEALGWKTEIDNTCDDWDYREASRFLLQRLRELRGKHPRVCLLSGGEITVRLEGIPGSGGRNQQFALACALELAKNRMDAVCPPHALEAAAPPEAIAILSAGSDGVDGMSPAAGAIADPTTVTRAHALGLDAGAALRSFNAYPLFHSLGDAVVSGPTGNNLRDLRILLSWK